MPRKALLGANVALFVLIAFFGGYWLGQSPLAPFRLGPSGVPLGEDAELFEPFWEVWNLTHARYFDQPLDDVALIEGAMEGMLATLGDDNTRYLTPRSQAAEQASMEGEFQGIGAEVTDMDGAITIVSPFEGSPAEAAGLRPGDILRAAGGVELTGMDVGEAAALVRGPAGTAVTLLVERDGETFTVDIVRDVIKIPSVRGRINEDGQAYIRLNRFATPTPEELDALLRELLAESPTGVILDLRMNPGGLLSSVIDVADQFLPEGIVMTERFGDGRETIYRSTNEGAAETVPLVVLVDEGSASASELLAGALRDRGRATVVGETTFGKGTVQSVHQLSNGGGLRITIARWLTPDGFWVHEQGLEPDVIIPYEGIIDAEDDPQLQAAVDVLAGRPVISASSPAPGE